MFVNFFVGRVKDLYFVFTGFGWECFFSERLVQDNTNTISYISMLIQQDFWPQYCVMGLKSSHRFVSYHLAIYE